MKRDLNIGEKLSFREEYFSLANELCEMILKNSELPLYRNVVAIGGESGCGKSTTAFCLEQKFNEKGIHAMTLHMDSYFHLPPKDNHQNRLENLENVGPHELNMELLNSHVEAFKIGNKVIEIPIVNYVENNFTMKVLNIENVNILIIEGVYAFLMKDLDHKIFLNRTYKDTFHNRKNRTRENYDPFVEVILEREHKFVLPMAKDADYIIDKNYSIQPV